MSMTKEQRALWEAVRPEQEPPADCQKCTRRHGKCAEFTALNRPNHPYNREWCHWYLEELQTCSDTPTEGKK